MIAVVVLVVATSSAFSTDDKVSTSSHTIDFTKPLVSFDGKVMKQSDAKDAPILTLWDVSVVALETLLEDDRTLPGIDKFKRDQLARKIYLRSNVEVSPEDIALIRGRIGKVYGPAVIGAAWPMLGPIDTK
jgi:hypothetical protein